eukprot:13203275-Heterocapsa_arctica.AAC.1
MSTRTSTTSTTYIQWSATLTDQALILLSTAGIGQPPWNRTAYCSTPLKHSVPWKWQMGIASVVVVP